VILADDMGYSDLGFFGSGIQTPNLDALARDGLIMTQFYNSGRCCPSRASLLTGVYQHEAGIGDMSADRGLPSYQGYLNNRVVTIAELLKEAGYHTMISGKWHVGNNKEHWPLNRGFNRFFGFPSGGGVYFYPFRPGRILILDSTEICVDQDTFYSTDAINDYAGTFLDEIVNPDQPFFLYIAHIAPHFPLQAWTEDIVKYRGKFIKGFAYNRLMRYHNMIDLNLVQKDIQLSEPDELVKNWDELNIAEKDSFDLRMAIYAAQIDRMDKGLGKIFHKIKEMGEWENTLIMFLSDNGGSHEDPRGWLTDNGPLGSSGCQQGYLRSWANVSNTPYRLYKHWVHEGGISTPLIAHWPDRIVGHRIDNQVGHIMDIMATCLDVTGVEYPHTWEGNKIIPLKGKSLLPVFLHKQRKGHQELFWEHEGNRAVRQGNWKLVSKYPENVWRLYDLSIDRAEMNDLSQLYREKTRKLIKEYELWSDQSGAVPWDQLISNQ
jgi:arylsulfatase